MAPPAKKRRKELVLDLSDKYRRNNPSKNFLFEPMLNYMLKNASQRAYYKLIQVSKYFLVNQPPQINKFRAIFYHGDSYPPNPDPYGVSKVSGNRLWIDTTHFSWNCSSVLVNGFLRRCFRIDMASLELMNQTLTYDELKFLINSGNQHYLHLNQCKITHSNGEEVAIEDILKMVPLLQTFFYKSREKFTFNSQKVAGLKRFSSLVCIKLTGITEDFCCKAFRSFLKKTSITSGRFRFADVSPVYLRKFLLTILKEIDLTIKVNCPNEIIYFGEFSESDEED